MNISLLLVFLLVLLFGALLFVALGLIIEMGTHIQVYGRKISEELLDRYFAKFPLDEHIVIDSTYGNKILYHQEATATMTYIAESKSIMTNWYIKG